MKVKYLATSIILATMLTGCGGGSSDGNGSGVGSSTKPLPPVKPQVKNGAFSLATGIANDKAAPILDGYTPFRFSFVNERTDISSTSPVRISIENQSSAIFRHYDIRQEKSDTQVNGHQFALQSYGSNTQEVSITLSYTADASQRTDKASYKHYRDAKAHYFFAPTSTDPDSNQFGYQKSMFRLFIDSTYKTGKVTLADYWDKAGKVAIINRLTHNNVQSDALTACIAVITNNSDPYFNTELVEAQKNTDLSHFVKGALPKQVSSKTLLVGLTLDESTLPADAPFSKPNDATKQSFLNICKLQNSNINYAVELDLMPYQRQDTALVLFNQDGKLTVKTSKLPLLTWRTEQQVSESTR
ncbi:hypothetical protein [Photobacterium sanguinicancri]|uniref:hypothetical protein n=1 Tax=Photobacterium sanguinicancri TaxID=875932 RepID=UPI0026E2AC48|nr:hypothetical protein [Photobacterium sanguinicancri]MDO6500930.1 hypothetical protein [Photobacterium sanguinicancri]